MFSDLGNCKVSYFGTGHMQGAVLYTRAFARCRTTDFGICKVAYLDLGKCKVPYLDLGKCKVPYLDLGKCKVRYVDLGKCKVL